MQNKPQLFCLTYAGGSAEFYDVIRDSVTGVEVVSLEYSGHGTRRKEPFYNDFAELADDLYEEIKKRRNGEAYGLFGYSMGSISLVEILKRILDRKEISPPVSLFIAAHKPLSWREFHRVSSDGLDEWARNRTIQFGAVPEKLMENKSFWRMYLPLYRADYSLIGRYRFEEMPLRTDIPAHIFYSETDTAYEDMKLWKHIFTGECAFHRFEGNHFFIRQHYAEISQIILAAMGRS
ncbi:MAG: thioesterase [Clostridia bacterium]|nr:thioesterase [Clostridia bacterium]